VGAVVRIIEPPNLTNHSAFLPPREGLWESVGKWGGRREGGGGEGGEEEGGRVGI